MEHPILFSGPMIRAILEGRKTQTRRIVKPKAWELLDRIREYNGKSVWQCLDFDVECPYGSVGDQLWVRETYMPHCGQPSQGGTCGRYGADAAWFHVPGVSHPGSYLVRGKPVPSIHMPRWASRITLEITDIRVQRLQEITFHEIEAEGFRLGTLNDTEARDGFAVGWNHLNAKRGYSWESNPWVWCIGFKQFPARSRE